MKYKIIVCVVPHNNGELIIEAAKQSGATGATVMMGKGTASSSVLGMLGFGDSSKDVVLIVIEAEKVSDVLKNIMEVTQDKKKFGVVFTLDAGTFIKAGHLTNENEGETIMDKENEYQMINIIVNKGYAEEAMAAARKAGAGGGTVIGARGTAKEGDAKFFGMEIVPEKEMLMILVPTEKKDDIINAIKKLECFSKAGSGIVFCNGAGDFTLLGKN